MWSNGRFWSPALGRADSVVVASLDKPAPGLLGYWMVHGAEVADPGGGRSCLRLDDAQRVSRGGAMWGVLAPPLRRVFDGDLLAWINSPSYAGDSWPTRIRSAWAVQERSTCVPCQRSFSSEHALAKHLTKRCCLPSRKASSADEVAVEDISVGTDTSPQQRATEEGLCPDGDGEGLCQSTTSGVADKG